MPSFTWVYVVRNGKQNQSAHITYLRALRQCVWLLRQADALHGWKRVRRAKYRGPIAWEVDRRGKPLILELTIDQLPLEGV